MYGCCYLVYSINKLVVWQASNASLVVCFLQSGILVVWKADGRGRPGQPVGQQKLDEQLTQIILIPPPAVDPA